MTSFTSFDFDKSLVIVPVEIGGHRIRLSLDTGSHEMILLRERLQNGMSQLPVKERIQGDHLFGKYRLDVVRLPEVKLGSSRWSKVTALVSHESPLPDSKKDGVLGVTSFGLKRIHFDFEHRVLSWEE